MNITSMERELHKPGGRSRNCFTAHFRADDNVPYERHMFRHMAPLSGES